MKQDVRLTQEQQKLVESHLSVVRWAIRESIHVNETIYGFSFDDLYQEGCILLCHAAATYDDSLSQFATYAKAVVRNGLYSYCRQMCRRQRRFCYLTAEEHGELTAEGLLLEQTNDFSAQVSLLETLELLRSCAKEYQGVTRLGIHALELRIKGMGVTEIAHLYHVPASHVGAWISRSAEKLKNDPAFLSGFC